MTADALNALVSSSIWRAEQLSELGLETATLAWSEVSVLEEELAKILPVKDAEGRIARRGAVNAAVKAKDYIRAQSLIKHYDEEKGVSDVFRRDLREIMNADAKKLAEEFPFAARHFKPNDVKMLANLLQQKGPFGLAA